jgi:CheY-like chemotaxis protein
LENPDRTISSARQALWLGGKSALVPVPHALVVLVVEDEFLLRCDVTDSLREAGYSVVETASGEEAIGFCKSNMSIDIVFTDISLIGSASGWDVGECFRADRPNVSLIYTSGKSIDPERRVPGSAFIAKPYQNDDVVDACERLHTK